MSKRQNLSALAASAAFMAACAAPAAAQTEIQWWLAMTGALGDVVKLATDSTRAEGVQGRTDVQGELSGDTEAAIAAFRSATRPNRPGIRGRHGHHDGGGGAIKPVAC